MDCQMDREQLQKLLDGELDGRKRVRLQDHLAGCPSCARRYETLKFIVRGVRSLPLYQASPQFHQKVLAALGYPAARPALRLRMKAALGTLLFLVSGWTAFVALSGYRTLGPLKIIQALEFLLHPRKLALLAQIWAVKLGVALIHFMPYVDGARRLLDSSFGGRQGMLELLLSSLLAGTLLFALSRNTSKDQWRKA